MAYVWQAQSFAVSQGKECEKKKMCTNFDRLFFQAGDVKWGLHLLQYSETPMNILTLSKVETGRFFLLLS